MDTRNPGLGLGRWAASGEDQFRGTFNVFGFDATQTFQGTVEIRFKGRVRGDSLSLDFTVRFFDTAGQLVPGPLGHGTATGERFQVKPL